MLKGLQSFTTTIGVMANSGPFAQPMPIVGITGPLPDGVTTAAQQTTLGQSVGIATAMQTGFYQPVSEYLETAPAPTAEGLNAVLGDLAAQGSPFDQVTVSPTLVDGDQVRFHLALDMDETANKRLFLGMQAMNQGLNVPAATTVPFNTGAAMDFSFGVNASAGTTPADMFFVRVNNVSATAAVNNPGNLSNVNVGLLKTDVGAAATLALSGQASAAFPNRDLTLADLEGSSITDLATMSASGSLNATLPIQVGLGDLLISNHPQITLAMNNIFSPAPTVGFNNDFVADGLDLFTNLNAQTFVSTLNQIGDWLDSLRNSPFLSAAIPFVANTTLGQIVALKDAWQAKVTHLLTTSAGALTFTSIQDLVGQLGSTIPGVHYSAGQLIFEVHLFDTLASKSGTIAFQDNLGPLMGVQSTSAVTLQGQVDATFQLGIDLHAVGAGDDWTNHFYLVSAGASQPTVNGLVALTAADINATANFGLARIGVAHGHGSVQAGFGLTLSDPGTQTNSDGRITLTEMLDGLGNLSDWVGTTGLHGSANITLPVQATILGVSLPANATITVTWSDLTDPTTLMLSYQNLGPLQYLANLQASDIANALNSVSQGLLASFEDLSF